MKKVLNPLKRSKSALLFVFVAAGIAMAVPACKKDDKATATLSSEDLNSAVTQALIAPDGGGVVAQTDLAVGLASNYGATRGIPSEDCGTILKDSAIVSVPDAGGISYNFSLYTSYLLTCSTESTIQQIQFDLAAKVKYTAPKISVNDSSTATFKVTGLDTDSSTFVINQKFNRKGSMTIASQNKTFLSDVTYISTNLVVNKKSRLIVSGTAAVTISGIALDGTAFSYAGTITFNGNKKATFTVAGGASTELSWL